MTDHHLLCLYPWLELGGADKFNLDMLARLAAHGWRSTIVTTSPSAHPWRDRFARLTDDIVDLTVYPPEQYPERLLHVVRSRSIDCVLLSCSSVGYDLLPYLHAQLPHIAFVDYCHMIETNWHDGGYPRMSLRAAGALDLQIVSSHSLKQWMCERGGEPSRIAVCTTNIDSAEWDPSHYDREGLRADLGIPSAAPVALYVARLERQKQPLLAVQVMGQVTAQLPGTYFLIAGDGRFAGCVRGYIRRHRLEPRVRMLGAVGNERVRELLALSDVFFLPSKWEGISLAIYEAMAMEVTPLSANVGGQAELVTPGCGVLVAPQPGIEQVYADELARLLREPALVRQMGQAARQRVINHFRLDKMGARMSELLVQAKMLHQTHPRPPISDEAVRAATEAGIYTAQRAAARTLRRRLRALYWSLADRGGWWLVYLIEQARRSLRWVRLRRNQIARSVRFARVDKH